MRAERDAHTGDAVAWYTNLAKFVKGTALHVFECTISHDRKKCIGTLSVAQAAIFCDVLPVISRELCQMLVLCGVLFLLACLSLTRSVVRLHYMLDPLSFCITCWTLSLTLWCVCITCRSFTRCLIAMR